MRPIPLQQREIDVSQLVLGCMGLGGEWDAAPITQEHVKQAHAAVEAALSIGINMFDHADIYTMGKAERVFGQVLRERKDLRSQIYIQSKCGIRFAEGAEIPGRYDFSTDHIRKSVDGSLQRLSIEYLDFLLLHRPDPLMDPQEVGETLQSLKTTGKVRHFGVSNMNAGQIQLLQSFCDEPLVINQLEMSLAKIGWLQTGVHVNQEVAAGNTFPNGTLEYLRLQGIQIQAWGPLAKGVFSGQSLGGQPNSVKATSQLVSQLAQQNKPPAKRLYFLGS